MKLYLTTIFLLISFLVHGQNVVVKIGESDTVYYSFGQSNYVKKMGVTYLPAIPPDISNLTLTQAGTSIALSWTDNSTNEDGFIIQRGAFGGTFTSIDTVTATTFNNTGLSYGTGYKYKIIAYQGSNLATGVKDSTTTWTWPKTMMESYVTINAPYVTYTQVEKDTIEGRLATGYMQTTFGPVGLNKTTCDFFMIFWNSNTSTNLTTRTNTKTGSTLRWNYGAGNIYSQNNLPAHINTGIITVSSTDGFVGYLIIDFSTNNFIGNFPIGSVQSFTQIYLSNNNFVANWTNRLLSSILNTLLISSNLFTGDFSNITIPANCTVIYLFSNSFNGSPPNITPHSTNSLTYRAYSLGFTSASNLTTFRKAMGELRLDGNALPTSKVDELLHNMAVWYAANAPTTNCTINLSGATMGIPTGGVSNTDLVALQAIWTAAGKTLTITVRTS